MRNEIKLNVYKRIEIIGERTWDDLSYMIWSLYKGWETFFIGFTDDFHLILISKMSK